MKYYVYLFDSACLLYFALQRAMQERVVEAVEQRNRERENDGEQVKSVISTLMLLLFSYICSRQFEY